MSAFECSACRAPIKARYGYCGPCVTEWRWRKRRPCSGGCGRVLVNNPHHTCCPDCLYRWRREYYARPNRLCGCGVRIRAGRQDHRCPACRRIDRKILGDRKKGKKV